jgi:hypothetical protein
VQMSAAEPESRAAATMMATATMHPIIPERKTRETRMSVS